MNIMHPLKDIGMEGLASSCGITEIRLDHSSMDFINDEVIPKWKMSRWGLLDGSWSIWCMVSLTPFFLFFLLLVTWGEQFAPHNDDSTSLQDWKQWNLVTMVEPSKIRSLSRSFFKFFILDVLSQQ